MTVDGFAETEWEELLFPDKVAGGKKACLRKAHLALSGREAGELAAPPAAALQETGFSKALEALAVSQASAAEAAAESEARVSSCNAKLVAALEKFAAGKKDDVVSVELDTALDREKFSLKELFPSDTWPESTAVRSVFPAPPRAHIILFCLAG